MTYMFSQGKVLKFVGIQRILRGSFNVPYPSYCTLNAIRILQVKNDPKQQIGCTHHKVQFIHISALLCGPSSDEGKPSDLTNHEPLPKSVAKKGRWQAVKAGLIHYYHGFRLFFVELKIACRLIVQFFSGKTLSRRERRHFTRTAADLFRMVPFLLFIIVPFMEFLLPFYLKFFPNALPSTFKEQSTQQEKLQKQMKIKLQVAKFLQDTLEETVRTASKKSHAEDKQALHDQFLEFMAKVRSEGAQPTNEEILKFASLIKDELTLENLSHFHLVALCQILNLSSVGPDYILRFQINLRLRLLAADDRTTLIRMISVDSAVRLADIAAFGSSLATETLQNRLYKKQLIKRDGIDSLNSAELQKACRDRGMLYMGVSEGRLRSQLSQWIDLHLNRRIPATLLLLSRAFYLPSIVQEEPEKFLKDTISALPTNVERAAALEIAEQSGEKIDNKEKLEALELEEKALAKEKKEKSEQQKVVVDQAHAIEQDSIVPETPTEQIASAIENLAVGKQIHLSALELGELKEDVEEHREQKLKQTDDYEIGKSAKILSKKINRLVKRLESLEKNLATKQASLQASIKETETRLAENIDDPTKQADMDALSTKRKSLIDVSEILNSIEKLKVPIEVGDDAIKDVLSKMDLDKDNKIDVVDLLEVLEYLHSEGVKPSREKLEELAELVVKQKLVDEQGLSEDEQSLNYTVDEDVSKQKQNS